jgi:hypothetical protein
MPGLPAVMTSLPAGRQDKQGISPAFVKTVGQAQGDRENGATGRDMLTNA